jgi:hypothetical protein
MFWYKWWRNQLNWLHGYCLSPLEHLIKKVHVPTKRATVILIKVNSCNALLHVLLVYIGNYLKSVLRYKLLMLGTYHPDTLYLDVRIRGYFSKQKEVREQKKVWETLI